MGQKIKSISRVTEKQQFENFYEKNFDDRKIDLFTESRYYTEEKIQKRVFRTLMLREFLLILKSSI